jgi:hypothetical protein
MAMKLKKSQLTKASKQLDGALEALELLFEYEEGRSLLDGSKIDFSAIVGLKNSVDELIEKKSRKSKASGDIKKISFYDLQRMNHWKEAVVVFTEDSFKKPYTELERSYKISSGDKYFDGNMGGNSLFGNCLDGTDLGVRLDVYIYEGWKPEFCYITEYKEEGAHNNE